MSDALRHPSVAALLDVALAEDLGRGDVTTLATVPASRRGRAAAVAREACVAAGLPLIEAVYQRVAAGAEAPTIELRVAEGDVLAAGAVMARISGSLATILSGERLVLNLVQHLSGIATLTHRLVDAVAGTNTVILDTRKTLPGLRWLQKYAVRVGGGRNHRFGLDDGLLIKDNHIAACGSVTRAVERARANAPHGLRIEVECETLAQVREALRAGADLLLLDNMTPQEVRTACGEIAGRARVEVSGGIRLETVRAYAEAGADFISVGRLTHSAPAIDIGLDVQLTTRSERVGRAARTRAGRR